MAIKLQDVQSTEFRDDVLAGLALEQKVISPRWLYDQLGSELFEQITDLPEYYVTRTEVSILSEVVSAFASEIGPEATVVEYGAGAALKVRLLLDALENPKQYVAIDISDDFLMESLKSISTDYPDLTVRPIAGDFLSDIALSSPLPSGPRVGFFPGSTIGNLSDDEINRFLHSARALLGDNAHLLLGADLRKSPDILIPAYDDAAGVTAGFNKNLITRINRELDGTLDIDQFVHKAVWNAGLGRIEMHLESLANQSFLVAGEEFHMASGETIHTENSRKFKPAQLHDYAEANGWEVAKYATDENDMFAVILLKAT